MVGALKRDCSKMNVPLSLLTSIPTCQCAEAGLWTQLYLNEWKGDFLEAKWFFIITIWGSSAGVIWVCVDCSLYYYVRTLWRPVSRRCPNLNGWSSSKRRRKDGWERKVWNAHGHSSILLHRWDQQEPMFLEPLPWWFRNGDYFTSYPESSFRTLSNIETGHSNNIQEVQFAFISDNLPICHKQCFETYDYGLTPSILWN